MKGGGVSQRVHCLIKLHFLCLHYLLFLTHHCICLFVFLERESREEGEIQAQAVGV